MIEIRGLFETHLNVASLDRAVGFYRDVLGLQVAAIFESRRVAFFWIGGAGKTMLGLWETGSGPNRMRLHTAFEVGLSELLESPARLRAAGVTPLDFNGDACDEPVVLAWMPAASVYFADPDGNQLEFLAMLPGAPRPERGVVPWREWSA